MLFSGSITILREHLQKSFVTLSGFWLFWGCGGESFSGSVKEEKFVRKIFLADNVERTEGHEICEKQCLPNDVKTIIKHNKK